MFQSLKRAHPSPTMRTVFPARSCPVDISDATLVAHFEDREATNFSERLDIGLGKQMGVRGIEYR